MKPAHLIRTQMNTRSFYCLALISILALSCAQQKAGLKAISNDEGIEIRQNDGGILFYQVKPKSLDGKYERSNYIHPLYSLKGNVITEDFPEDHLHHHGLYSAWHQVLLNGTPIADGWVNENISWKILDSKVEGGGNTMAIRSEVLWVSPVRGDMEKIVKEDLVVTVQPSNDQLRIIDYDMRLLPLKEGLAIGGSEDEKGYGGFSLRLKLPGDIKFIARGGEVQAQVVAVEAGPWMNFVGSFDGDAAGRSGIVVFSHPSNPGHPQPWILRKEKSMQNPAYPGRLPVTLSKDGLALRYRMIVHNGSLNTSKIEKLYRDYSKLDWDY